jgi:hypothetical protein
MESPNLAWAEKWVTSIAWAKLSMKRAKIVQPLLLN